MKKNIFKRFALIIAIATFSANVIAQSSAPYRIFDLQPDVKSQSLGGTHLVSGSENYVYANPTQIFKANKAWSISVSGQLLPKYADMSREQYGTASLGYRINNKNALFVGVRYLTGGKIDAVNNIGQDSNSEINTTQMTVDAGYAFALNEQWSSFATVTLLKDNTIRSSSTMFAGVGLSYKNSFEPLDVEATLAAYNLGKDVDYGKDMSYRLPTTIALGGSASRVLNDEHSLGLKAQVGYVTSYSTTQVGAGLEYCFRNLLALRGGYNHLDTDVGFATVGLGLNFSSITLDASYIIGVNEYTQNTLALGVSFEF